MLVCSLPMKRRERLAPNVFGNFVPQISLVYLYGIMDRLIENWFLMPCQPENWFLMPCQLENWFLIPCQSENWFLISCQSENLFLIPCQPENWFIIPCQPENWFLMPCQPEKWFLMPCQPCYYDFMDTGCRAHHGSTHGPVFPNFQALIFTSRTRAQVKNCFVSLFFFSSIFLSHA